MNTSNFWSYRSYGECSGGHEVLKRKASRALLADNADAVVGVGIAMKTAKDGIDRLINAIQGKSGMSHLRPPSGGSWATLSSRKYTGIGNSDRCEA